MKRIWKKVIEFLKKLFGKDKSKQYELAFVYGGFAGGNAKEDKDVQIANFQMNERQMSYVWKKNDLGKWGYAPNDFSGTYACAFFFDEASKKWIGGKFDFISSSRLTRSWTNIKERYNGWNPNRFFSAQKHGFCIVSCDGTKRTNLITDC